MSHLKNTKMRPVTADRNMRRSYNRAIDDGDQNPYASMYSRAFGAASANQNTSRQTMQLLNHKTTMNNYRK